MFFTIYMTYRITFLWGRGKNSWSWRMKYVDCHVYYYFNMVAYVYSAFCSSLKMNRLLVNKWCLFYWQKKCCFGAIFCSPRYPLRTLQHHIHEHISSQGPLCLVFIVFKGCYFNTFNNKVNESVLQRKSEPKWTISENCQFLAKNAQSGKYWQTCSAKTDLVTPINFRVYEFIITFWS